jgi:hypothetical protein
MKTTLKKEFLIVTTSGEHQPGKVQRSVAIPSDNRNTHRNPPAAAGNDMKQTIRSIGTVVILGLYLLPWESAARPGRLKTPPEAMPTQEELEFQAMVRDLQSPDPEVVIFSVQMLGLSGRAEAVPPLVELLRRGPRDDITNMALDTLGALGRPDAVDTLLRYLRHRRPDARLAALNALSGIDAPEVTRAIEDRLRDSDPDVRAAAATALGSRGDKESVVLLFRAFDLSVNEAAIAIGKRGADPDALRLLEYLGKINIRILLPGLREFALRADIDQKTKLHILNQLYELAGPDVRRFAIELRDTLNPAREKSQDDPILKMLDRMVQEIAGE